MTHMSSAITKKIKQIAALRQAADHEEFSVHDYCGGSMDDAYQTGVEDGEIAFARCLLALINAAGPALFPCKIEPRE
jgi:hypothetical protein